jgi:hypothetical protein
LIADRRIVASGDLVAGNGWGARIILTASVVWIGWPTAAEDLAKLAGLIE